MSASTLAWPITSVRTVLSDQDYGVMATRAGTGALVCSSGEIWPFEDYRLRLKASIDSAPQKSINVEVYGPAPAWLIPALKSVTALLGLERDWDSYGAPPITARAIVKGIEVLAQIMSKESLPPVFVPTSQGGCQLEWHTSGRDLEIEISPEREPLIFFQDRTRNCEGEGSLSDHLDTVRGLLRELVQ